MFEAKTNLSELLKRAQAGDKVVITNGGRLVGAHNDPFDRLIAAHALRLDIPVISNDTQLDTFGVRRIR